MRKKAYEEFNAFKVRFGVTEVDYVQSVNPFWKEVLFTATGLRKLRAAMAKLDLKIQQEHEAQEKAKADARYQFTMGGAKTIVADGEFERFDFGGLEIADSDGWATETGSNDWTKNVYAENPKGGDSVRLSFHVIFDNKRMSLRVKEAYCLDFNTGVLVGKRGEVKA